MKIYNLPFDLSSADVPSNQPVIIRAYQSQHNTIRNRIILHQNMINLLISGTKTIVYADDTTTINQNELLVLSCGNCLTTEVLPGDNIFSSIIIYFGNDVLTNFFIKYSSLLNVKRQQMVKRPVLTYQQDAFIKNYIGSLGLMLERGAGLSSELKLLKLEELLLYLLEQDAEKLQSLLTDLKDNDDLRLRRAVESNINNAITVEELAFLCNTSVSTFKRKFSRLYGSTPQKWLFEQKMQFAANLLKHPEERPGMVYQKVGYESHSSFSNAFRQQYGITPTEYHNQNLNL